MLIGIISDSHDNMEHFLKTIDFMNEKKVEYVLHLGDWVSPFMIKKASLFNAKVIGIFGNNEGHRQQHLGVASNIENLELHDEDTIDLELDGKKIAMTHGHRGIISRLLLESDKYDLICSGHTHKPLLEDNENTIHLNPGSVCGMNGPEFKPKKEFTVALYDTSKNKAEIVTLE